MTLNPTSLECMGAVEGQQPGPVCDDLIFPCKHCFLIHKSPRKALLFSLLFCFISMQPDIYQLRTRPTRSAARDGCM